MAGWDDRLIGSFVLGIDCKGCSDGIGFFAGAKATSAFSWRNERDTSSLFFSLTSLMFEK